jgi:competence protein ComEA
VVVAGAGLWYLRSLPRNVEVQAAKEPDAVPPPAATSGASPGPSSSAVPASPVPSVLFVHVAGLVRHPGVYQFQPGQRIIDAVQEAGGPLPKADLDLLNLASPLADGQQILIPAKGSAPPPLQPPIVGGTGTALPGGVGGLVNINTATDTELEELPGIGPVTAAEIIAYRTEHGPFPTVDALDDVSGIGPATMEQLRPLVTV